ncbi:MAG: phospholipid carrier-dependent glycosyltransferase [Acidobacteria bacterium]|nr:phospholipid carrier-dependent glycosyltransferase [Acidobacteriota bacterium]NIM63236.1 phospholipid carrier-dependent glycosyltransferase [Acidobacteriota bacterium]NIO61014.1 phospholipid carrier-dependent glycosyltransferase [Acidobacteriota bacterium]NIQ87523.1 phospholipid carrier-dependent glycosyltransferase [Acidobacteriota bacterium]NIT12651.1 phospholipid carrier-dependent glycosyltransferase [Acidobacteriota bacterium]
MGPSRPTVRRDLFVLCLLALALFLPGLGSRDLWNPNEPAYGLAVAEMTERGDWWTPTVNGTPFHEKPILYFWLARVTTALFGVNELALRLPSLLAGIVTVAFVYLLGAGHAGRRRGILAAVLFSTTVTIAQAARMIQMDLLATAAVAATVYFGLETLGRPDDRWPSVATGLAAGLGFLAKGPVTWVVAAIPLGAAIVLARPRAGMSARFVALGLGGLVATVSIWIVPLVLRGDWDALHESLVRQNFTRFVEPWDHAQPWWYFLKYLWIDMAPWAFLLPLAVGGRGGAERRLDRAAWAWLLGAMLFFSLSASKRSAYLMPVAPAVALLAAGVVERLIGGSLDLLRRRVVLALLCASGLALLATGWIALEARTRYGEHSAALTAVAIAVFAAAAAILAALSSRKRVGRASVCFLAVLVALEVGTGGWLLPYANVFKSARAFAAESAAVAGEDPISGYKHWIWRADYPYYLGRSIGRIEQPEEARRAWNGEPRHCLIVEEWERADFLSAVGPANPLVARDVGSKGVELYCNR